MPTGRFARPTITILAGAAVLLAAVVHACATVALVTLAAAQGQGATPLRQTLLREQARLEFLLVQDRQREARYTSDLASARDVLDRAGRAGHAAARQLAQRAVVTADGALTRARAVTRFHQAWLGKVERALSWADRTDGAAVVIDLRGDVERLSQADWHTYDGQTPLQPGETIRTSEDGLVRVLLADGGELTLGGASEVRICIRGCGVYEALKGRLHVAWGCRGEPGCVSRRMWELRYGGVPTACACVRGTEFDYEVLPEGPVRLTVFEGEVEFRDDSTGEFVHVTGGQRFLFTPGRSFPLPESVGLRDTNRWWEGSP